MSVTKRNTIEIDVMRLDKAKFREWKKGDGSTAKFCSMDIVYTDKREPVKKKDGTVVQGGGKTLFNVGFVVQSKANKDEENGVILGSVKELVENDDANQTSPDENGDVLSLDQIPF